FHLTPFRRIWRSPLTGCEQHVYDELYTSDVWIQAHDEIMKQRREDDCQLERVIVGMMFWSDTTHLAQFGHASAWPIYLFFGIYPSKPIHHIYSHVTYLPESIHSFISSFSTKKNNTDILTHCKRELIHAIWRILLDDEFIDGYRNGIVVKCFDGVIRRIYPQIFTYSADYPEKIILATLRDKGNCPCPRCLIPKSSFHQLGFLTDLSARLTLAWTYLQAKIDEARRAIYQLGMPLKGVAVEHLLKAESLLPTWCALFPLSTSNSFSECLGQFSFNIFPVLVVDLLHEFELGVAKSVLRHLIHLIHAIDPNLVNTLNER
ncbi:hypothetical protein SCLCIDRAFT_111422, partial [Scleroderma citrinum Foug A]